MKDLPATRGDNQGELRGSFDSANSELSLVAFVTNGSQLDSQIVYLSPVLASALGAGRLPPRPTLADIVGESADCLHGSISTQLGERTHGVPVTLVRQPLQQSGLYAWLVCETQPLNVRADTLVRQLAHELNNPLTSVLWKLDLLTRQLPKTGGDARRLAELCRHVDEAHQGIKRVVELVKEFAESVQVWQVQTEAVDLAEVVQDSLSMLACEIELCATLVCDFSSVSRVRGHRSRLVRVFSNLLFNALQAVRESQVPQDHRIRVSIEPRGCWVVGSVEDTGVGMSESLVRRVFEPFVTTRAASGGSGLGLFISRQIVESLGGHLEVDSCELTGTSFRVWLRSIAGDTTCGSAPPVSHRRALGK